MNIRYPIYEGVYRILTIVLKSIIQHLITLGTNYLNIYMTSVII